MVPSQPPRPELPRQHQPLCAACLAPAFVPRQVCGGGAGRLGLSAVCWAAIVCSRWAATAGWHVARRRSTPQLLPSLPGRQLSARHPPSSSPAAPSPLPSFPWPSVPSCARTPLQAVSQGFPWGWQGAEIPVVNPTFRLLAMELQLPSWSPAKSGGLPVGAGGLSLSQPASPLTVFASWLCDWLPSLHPWMRLPAAPGDRCVLPWWQPRGVPRCPSLVCPGTRAGTLRCSAQGALASGAGGIWVCFPSSTQVTPTRQWHLWQPLAVPA